MSRYDLTDFEWRVIEPLLPNKPRGVPRVEEQGATSNIPPKSNRKWKPCFSKRLYRERNLLERFFSKLKHFRRVATRYDKLAANFLAMVQLASMRLWLRAYEPTAQNRNGRYWLAGKGRGR